MALIHEVLDLARWAPSGDNTQPWRFEIRSETSALIHGYDTRTHCVYDLDGHASELAHGALLESVTLAATRFGVRATDSILDEGASGHNIYGVELQPTGSPAREDPLVSFIRERTVERRALRTSPLADDEREALARSVDGFDLVWMSPLAMRWRLARLNMRNAHIRLTIPEAFAVHKAVIAWDATTSEDRLPDAALGAGPMLLRAMRFAMASFERAHFLNRFAGGTLLPRLALDLLPGIRCATHFALIARNAPARLADRVSAGRAMQRLWLTATQLGLRMQPSYTPLVFARYARAGIRFTRIPRAQATAMEIAHCLDDALGEERAAKCVFLGRLGRPLAATRARSIRLPLERLIVTNAPRALSEY
jgi:hypothetical protein